MLPVGEGGEEHEELEKYHRQNLSTEHNHAGLESPGSASSSFSPFSTQPLSQHKAVGRIDALVVVRDRFLNIESMSLSDHRSCSIIRQHEKGYEAPDRVLNLFFGGLGGWIFQSTRRERFLWQKQPVQYGGHSRNCPRAAISRRQNFRRVYPEKKKEKDENNKLNGGFGHRCAKRGLNV